MRHDYDDDYDDDDDDGDDDDYDGDGDDDGDDDLKVCHQDQGEAAFSIFSTYLITFFSSSQSLSQNMIPPSIFLLITQSNKLAVAANVFVYSRTHLISMATCLYTVLMLMVNSSSKMNSVLGLCPPKHCHPSVCTCYSQRPKTSYFEKWVSF